MKKLSICCVAASAILLASCATTKVEATAVAVEPVLNGSWESIELVKEGTAVTGATATLTFADPTFAVYGNAGVNNYFGNIEKLEGTDFASGSGLGSTMMAGEENAMAFERAYLEAFEAADTISAENDNLVISGDTVKIVYTKNADGMWETTSVEKDGAAVTGAKATLAFVANYAVDGTSGVNQIFGSVSVDNGKFEVTEPFGATKMLGAPTAQAFEDAFLTILPTLNKVALDGETLTISNDTSKVVFNKAAVAPIESTSAAE